VSISGKIKQMRQNQNLNRLLVGSQFVRNELLQNGFDEEKVSILPPVIRMKPVDCDPAPEESRVLFVGQLIRGKGVDLLLHALTQTSSSVYLDVVGTGNAEEELHRLAQDLELEERVRFHGWVPHDEISAFYARAKLLAVPSRWPEPFGMIGLEAMAHQRPVVAFAVGGIPDWLEDGETGFLAPEQDVEALARAMDKVALDTGLAREMGEKGLERLMKDFRFEDYLDKTEKHLAEVLQ
jgi:glycosyltransferase involved in cell wall biosynthesis